jgi:6-phosphogluconolactonase
MKNKHTYALLFFITLLIGCKMNQPSKTYRLFVGTYTDGESEGIYSYSFNASTGELSAKKLAATLPNPSFLTISHDKQNLYAVQETADFDSLGGGVSAFKISDGLLTFQNSLGTGGAHPCHVSLIGKNQLVVSNYTGGNVMVADLEDDGSLSKKHQIINHISIDTLSKPHAHMAKGSRGELFVSDLGLDAIKRYQNVDDEFIAGKQPSIDLKKGAGPRHFVFSENHEFLYVINELNSTITLLQRNAENVFNEVDTISTISKDFNGDSYCADLHLSKDGKFLYGSNRGENTIVIFMVDEVSGKLKLAGREAVRGDWPRNFTLDPTNNFLLVANQKSDNVSIFKRDTESGALTFLKSEKLPNPVCLQFLN